MRFKKHIAFSLMELLLIIISVGIIATMFTKLVRADKITSKYTAYGAYNNLINMTSAVMQKEESLSLPDNFCETASKMVSTIDNEINCDEESSAVPIKPNFTLVNGMSIFGLDVYFNEMTKEKIAYVDLNGSADPDMLDATLPDNVRSFKVVHSLAQNRTRNELPDIVAFKITSSGDVLPLGLAGSNTDYLRTKIVQVRSDGGNLTENILSGLFSFQEAYCKVNGERIQDANNIEPASVTTACNAGKIAECSGSNYCFIRVLRPGHLI